MARSLPLDTRWAAGILGFRAVLFQVLPGLRSGREGARFELIFIDGSHFFDDVSSSGSSPKNVAVS